MRLMHELRKLSRGLQPKTAPIPISIPGLGSVGHLSHQQGVYINSAYRNPLRSLMADEARADRVAREISRGRLGADALLPLAARISDRRDAIAAIKSMQGAIQSFNDIIDARGTGQYCDWFGHKASQTTVANQWSSFISTAGGMPPAASYTAAPGGARMTSASTGAVPIPCTIGGSDHLYLANAAAQHVTGSNIHFYVDLLVAAGNLQAGSGTTATTSQNISSTSLSRWTTGEGTAMTMEITTAFGTATGIPTITISYTDQAGNTGNSTGAISIGATSMIAGRLFPIQDGPMIRLASGDYGVRVIEGCIFSAASASGIFAALVYKPLMVIPTFTVNYWTERSTPAMLSGIKQLTSSVGGEKPFVGRFILPSTSSTGTILEWLEFVYS